MTKGLKSLFRSICAIGSKTFSRRQIPISIVLVIISLVGFLVFQISWVVNLMTSSQQRTIERVSIASKEVVSIMTEKLSLSIKKKSQTIPFWLLDDISSMPQITTVKDNFTIEEIEKLFKKSLQKHHVKDIAIEFGIINNYLASFTGETNLSMGTNGFLSIALAPDYAKTGTSEPIVENIGINTAYGISERLVVFIPNISQQVLKTQATPLLVFVLYSIITLAAFYLTVKNMLQQRNLNRIKSDFINNMTHEFKTPLATISLAVDALQNDKVRENAEKQRYFSNIIKEENKKMHNHVETILKAAFTDKQKLSIDKSPIDAHEIIKTIVPSFDLRLQEKNNGYYILNLNASNSIILGDSNHFANLVNNLMDNAVKYAQPDTTAIIEICTHSNNKFFTLSIKDNGVGMSKETVKRIFEKFYRAHTGNLHNVKGFGLGMNYVKSIVDAHHGKIRIHSALDKGSTFIVDLPLASTT